MIEMIEMIEMMMVSAGVKTMTVMMISSRGEKDACDDDDD